MGLFTGPESKANSLTDVIQNELSGSNGDTHNAVLKSRVLLHAGPSNFLIVLPSKFRNTVDRIVNNTIWSGGGRARGDHVESKTYDQ